MCKHNTPKLGKTQNNLCNISKQTFSYRSFGKTNGLYLPHMGDPLVWRKKVDTAHYPRKSRLNILRLISLKPLSDGLDEN